MTNYIKQNKQLEPSQLKSSFYATRQSYAASQKLTLEQDKVKRTVFDMIKWSLLKEKKSEMLSVLEFYKECSYRQKVWKVYFVVLNKLKLIL
jgi:hypothetical protein